METVTTDFDIHDLEALQTIINHCSHALGERIIALETELQDARDTIAAYETKSADQ